MIIVHHLNNSRSQRILWLLEELGLEYEIKHYQRDPVTELAPDSLRKVHPLGKSPVISDGEVTLAESGAIIEYLATKYSQGNLLPAADSPNHWQCKYWLHYAEGSLMPLFVIKLIFDKIKNGPLPFFIKPIGRIIADKVWETYLGPNITNHLSVIEAHLGKQPWFAGDAISIADIQMSFPLEAGMLRAPGNYPHIKAWLAKIHARDAYKKALEAGGPYDYA